jgi:hypothetical protein
LAAAKKAVEVLKGEKEHTQNKLEKLHAVLEKERSALRDVLSAARKAVDDLKLEKQEIVDELEQSKKTVTLHEAEIERLKALLRNAESKGADASGLERELREANRTIDELRTKLARAESSSGDQLSQLRAELQRAKSDAAEDRSRYESELANLRRQLAEAQQSAGDTSRDAQSRRRLSQECGLRLLNSILKRKREVNLSSALYLWAGENAGGAGGASQEEMDAFKMQMDGQFRRLQMRLSSTRKESGTRWMNHILGRWRLHHLVSFLHYWRAIIAGNNRQADDMARKLLALRRESGLRGLRDIFRRVAYGAVGWAFTTWKEELALQDALSEAEELANAKIRDSLATAGRGLKRWMEEHDPNSSKKAVALKLMAKIISEWTAGTVRGMFFNMKMKFMVATSSGMFDRERQAAELTEKALEAELIAMKQKLTASEAERSNLEQELAEALKVLERGMAELKAEKADMDARLETERANFLRVMRDAEKDRLKAAEDIAALKGGGGDVDEERRQKLVWKREAEHTAKLFDDKKQQFDLAMRDGEFKQALLKKQLSQAESDLTACKDELFSAVGDLAHLQIEAENNRKLSDDLNKRNQQLENLVSRHVVEGAVLSGFLLKQGSKMETRWHQRWCVLDGAALSLYVDKETRIAKTIIPLMKVTSVAADPSTRKNCLAVRLNDGNIYRFDTETEGNMKEWQDALEQMRASAEQLSKEWQEIKQGYSGDMQLLRDRILQLEQELTDLKTTGATSANEALKNMQNKFELLEMSLTKMDDDLWLWIDRNMWHTTTVQGLGFGNVSTAVSGKATAVGGKPCDASTTVSWSDAVSGVSHEAVVTHEHCYAASDDKDKVYTVNFTAPADSKNLQAIIKVAEVEVHKPPPVPQATTAEVKKLQRLMTLRNPSPPRSRQEKRAAEQKSPRGKSPPKGRTLNLGSVAGHSNEPAP